MPFQTSTRMYNVHTVFILYIYTRVYMHICIWTHKLAHKHVYKRMFVHMCVDTYTHISMVLDVFTYGERGIDVNR